MTDFHFDPRQLIAWGETKNPDKEYSYVSPGGCYLAMFFRENGYPNSSVGPGYVRPWGDDRVVTFPEGWEYVARGGLDDLDNPHRLTFRNALARARIQFQTELWSPSD